MNEIEARIRQKARDVGIDENVAVAVAKSEALNVFRPDQPDRGGDEGSSFGPYQFHYAGLSKSMPNAGLGDEFTRTTRLDARDPSTWPQQVDFALDYAAKHGWGSWMGAKNTGIGDWEGIKGGQPSSALAGMMSTTPTAGPQSFQPVFGDVVAVNQVPVTPYGDDINSLGLGFLRQAEERRDKKDQAEREAEADRRRALFAQTGLGGLYG